MCPPSCSTIFKRVPIMVLMHLSLKGWVTHCRFGHPKHSSTWNNFFSEHYKHFLNNAHTSLLHPSPRSSRYAPKSMFWMFSCNMSREFVRNNMLQLWGTLKMWLTFTNPIIYIIYKLYKNNKIRFVEFI